MDCIDKKDGNRKLKLIACKNCSKEWLIRKDREHSGLCKRCRASGKNNPMYGKIPYNKGKNKYDISCTKFRWIKAKKEIVLLMGNKCMRCKEQNMPIYCYEVHHRDPETKLFSVFSKITSWFNNEKRKIILDELKKCDLVCKNCHSIIHYGNEKAQEI